MFAQTVAMAAVFVQKAISRVVRVWCDIGDKWFFQRWLNSNRGLVIWPGLLLWRGKRKVLASKEHCQRIVTYLKAKQPGSFQKYPK